MSTTATLSYFYGKEADQFAFFTVPKILFTDERYKDLPCEAKMLYGMMLDRMSLSIANQWFDDQKRAYIRISTEYITENLGCGRNKALNFMKLLEEHGLIERVKHGQGKASTVYVKKFVMVEAREQEAYEDIIGEEGIGQLKDYNDAIENEPVQDIPEENEEWEDTGVKFRNQTSEEKEESSEVPKLNFKKFKNQTSRSLESKPLEVYFSNPNNTDINNTDLNNNKSNPIVSAEDSSGTEDEMGCDDDWNKQIQAYSVLIKENIGYSDLLMTHPLEKNLIDGIVDLILETVLCDSEKILIASNWYPAQLVKSKFLKLNYSNIEYAMYCFNGNTKETYRDNDDSDAVQLAAFIKGYIQSVDENLNKIIRFLDNATLSYADEKRMRKKNDEEREIRLHTITTNETGDGSESSGGTVGVSADAGERTEDCSE